MNSLLLGVWRTMIPIPGTIWKGEASKGAREATARLGFMSGEHHRVRDFVVCELPRVGKPLSLDFIASELDLTFARVSEIVDELERNMTFLYRSDGEAITWAYPVTVDRTPHHVTFSSGEEVYAA